MSDTGTLAGPTASLVRRSPNRALAYLVGAAYLSAGVVGGAVTLGAAMAPGGGGSAGLGTGWTLTYVLLGVALVSAAARGRARQANTLAGGAYLVACVPLLAGDVCSGPFQLNRPEGLLHLVSAALLLGFGRTQE